MLEYGDQIEISQMPQVLSLWHSFSGNGAVRTPPLGYVFYWLAIVFSAKILSLLSLWDGPVLVGSVTAVIIPIIFPAASYLGAQRKEVLAHMFMICLTIVIPTQLTHPSSFKQASSGVIAEEVDLSVAAVDSDLGGTNFFGYLHW
ncbi:hypothetical protein EI94DRAFT_1705943 [Lactarius quietus]|nr:hypothetical protein EI94DRAFT_1705943 [Lactarius quietus]